MILLLLYFLFQSPYVDTFWSGTTLVVVASPGSLYLVGGDFDDTYIGQEYVTLGRPRDHLHNPLTRDAIELRNTDGNTIARVDIPKTYIVILPLIDVTEAQNQ